MNLRIGELVMALAVLGLGLLALWGASHHAYRTEFGPDAGFFPFWIGLAAALIGASLVALIAGGRLEPAAGEPGEAAGTATLGNRTQLVAVGLFIAYAAVMPHLGFALATLAFLLALALASEPGRPLKAVLYASGTTLGLVLLFQKVFRMPLPTGLL